MLLVLLVVVVLVVLLLLVLLERTEVERVDDLVVIDGLSKFRFCFESLVMCFSPEDVRWWGGGGFRLNSGE